MSKALDYNKLWKILKEMGISDHLTVLLRNLYAGQEATVRTGQGTKDWFKIGKEVYQGCILSPCLFNFYPQCCCSLTQLCPNLCNPMDCLLHPWDFPGKNTGVGCISFSRGSSQPRDRAQVSHIAGRCFTI